MPDYSGLLWFIMRFCRSGYNIKLLNVDLKLLKFELFSPT